MIRPRQYQTASVAAVLAEFDRGVTTTLVELPTGTGKTIVFALVGHSRHWGRVLVLAPRRELVFQAQDKIAVVTGDVPDIEMGDLYAPIDKASLFTASKYVVGTVQTFAKDRRMGRFDLSDFGLVVIDEGHHATAATYRKVVDAIREANPNVKILLVTATPDRADGKGLAQAGVESVAYQYRIDQAVDDGYLVPPHQYFAEIQGLDFSKVHTTDGDLDEGELEAIYRDDGGALTYKVAAAAVQAGGGRRTLIFMPRVESAKQVAEVINRMPGQKAVAVDGSWDHDRRKAVLEAYGRGEFQYLVNCQLFTEGWDEPKVEVVVMARPTKSRALYAQCVGRGLRPLPGVVDGVGANDTPDGRRSAIASSPKSRCLVVDLVGNSGRHKLVCTADILGAGYESEVVEAAKKRAKKRKTPADMKALLEDEKEKLAQRRAAADAARVVRKAKLYATAKVDMTPIDPFRRDVAVGERDLTDGERQQQRATSSSVELLEKLGVPALGLSDDEAKKLVREHFARKKAGLCSLRQKHRLGQLGIDAQKMTRDRASALLDLAKAGGWVKPPPLTRDMVRVRPMGDNQYQLIARLPTTGKLVKVGKQWADLRSAQEYGKYLIAESKLDGE